MSFLRKLWRIFRWVLALILVGALVMVALGWRAFGHGADAAEMSRSPRWRDGHFVNPQPLVNSWWGAIEGMFEVSPHASPAAPPPVVRPDLSRPPASGLRATWLGHSTVLLEIDGRRVLTDPVWSERVGPYSFLGPRRFAPPPLPLDELPPLDAVVISHDHYDHLDQRTIEKLAAKDTRFIVPLGVGAHLIYWGVAPGKITELDWWESVAAADLTITATPARHASGRMLLDDDAKLWAGWAFAGPAHRVYYSGDTGLFPGLRDIGARLGPFDLTMIEIGQYGRAWPDWHAGPEQAVQAHRMVGGKLMLPVHWGTYQLAYHGWTEPIERAIVAAAPDVTLVAPKPGQSFEPATPPSVERWWPDVPWVGAAEDPIVSGGMDSLER